MALFAGQFERTIDEKNRLQFPSQMRTRIDPKEEGSGFYVTLGDFSGTLSVYTERAFERLAERIETEFIPGDESRRFELQFYGLATFVEMDKQGRIILPDRLRRKARLSELVYLVGRKHRIDIWNRADFDRSVGISWDGDDWPDQWERFLRMRPESSKQGAGSA